MSENVVTFRCDDELLEEIDAAADASRFKSRASFLRWHLEETVGESNQIDIGPNQTQEELSRRVSGLESRQEELEERIASIENDSRREHRDEVDSSRINSTELQSDRINSISETGDPAPPDASIGAEPDAASAGTGDSVLRDALEGWNPGRTQEEREKRRESALAVLAWLRDQPDTVRAMDVKTALYDDHALEGQNEQTWWENVARDALQHAADRGYVDTPGRMYEWAGE